MIYNKIVKWVRMDHEVQMDKILKITYKAICWKCGVREAKVEIKLPLSLNCMLTIQIISYLSSIMKIKKLTLYFILGKDDTPN